MKKKILVAGGAGFLGSHLCEALVHQGHHIVCVDNFSTGSLANLAHFLGDIEVIHHDICDPIDLHIDEIYNLACPASPVHYQSDPVRTIKTSFLGAMNLLDLARKTGARILQASTSEVYGDPQVHPQPESYWGYVNPIGIRACYDEGKRCAETLFFDYKRQYNVNIAVARIFNTYGPRMHPNDGRVVSNFIVQALQGKPLTVFGHGEQTRSFCFVSDLIQGLMLLMKSTHCGPINLGNPVERTMNELAQLVLTLTQSQAEICYQDLPQDDPQQRRPDITEAKKLGWTPQVSLESGLKTTIDYFVGELSHV